MAEHKSVDEPQVETIARASTSVDSQGTQTTDTFPRTEAQPDAPNGKGFVARWFDSTTEWIASRPLGQVAFRGSDRILRLVEKSLVWSTQPRSVDENNIEGGVGVVLVSRPLSWPLFLPMLVILKVLRIAVYVLTFGSQDTQSMIRWLQCKRRRIRAIKYAGIRTMRARQALSCKWTWGPFSALGWLLGLGGASKAVEEETSEGALASPSDKKRKWLEVEQSDWTDDSEDEDEDLATKLNNFSKDYDSASDPDFEPGSGDESSSSDDEDGVLVGEDGAVVGEEEESEEEKRREENVDQPEKRHEEYVDQPPQASISANGVKTPARPESPSITYYTPFTSPAPGEFSAEAREQFTRSPLTLQEESHL